MHVHVLVIALSLLPIVTKHGSLHKLHPIRSHSLLAIAPLLFFLLKHVIHHLNGQNIAMMMIQLITTTLFSFLLFFFSCFGYLNCYFYISHVKTFCGLMKLV